jgi:Glyoxalase/Bleomycin resistance protein/Dioxygenase superfamily
MRSQLCNWLENTISKSEGCQVEMPDERKAVVSPVSEQIGRSGKYKAEIKKLLCQDGQSIYITKISKGSYEQSVKRMGLPQLSKPPKELKGHGCGSKIPVASFEKAIWFYRDFLGLTIKKQTQDVVVFDQGMVLVPMSYAANLPDGMHLRAIIYIQTTDIDKRFSWVKGNEIKAISPLAPWISLERYFSGV